MFIYFDKKTQENIVNSFYNSLKKEGCLILGSSETLYNIKTDFKRFEIGNAIIFKK